MEILNGQIILFPARAGMNRADFGLLVREGTVPRTRGDEPAFAPASPVLYHCSPHARG